MISMVVLAIGLVGALAALQRGATEARLGQNRQMKMMLADAALQRIRFMDKAALVFAAPAQPTVNVLNLPLGAAPWVRDPTTTTDPLDFSQGAYFKILPDGTLTAVPVAETRRALTPSFPWTPSAGRSSFTRTGRTAPRTWPFPPALFPGASGSPPCGSG